MPKIFVLRDRLAEQQARLRANDKNGVNGGGGNGFPVNLASSSAPAASEDAAGTSQQQQQPLNLQSRPQYVAPKIGKKEKQRKSLSLSLHVPRMHFPSYLIFFPPHAVSLFLSFTGESYEE